MGVCVHMGSEYILFEDDEIERGLALCPWLEFRRNYILTILEFLVTFWLMLTPVLQQTTSLFSFYMLTCTALKKERK